MPAVPAKIAYLSCDLPHFFTLAVLLCLLVPAQIQLALRTAHAALDRLPTAPYLFLKALILLRILSGAGRQGA